VAWGGVGSGVGCEIAVGEAGVEMLPKRGVETLMLEGVKDVADGVDKPGRRVPFMELEGVHGDESVDPEGEELEAAVKEGVEDALAGGELESEGVEDADDVEPASVDVDGVVGGERSHAGIENAIGSLLHCTHTHTDTRSKALRTTRKGTRALPTSSSWSSVRPKHSAST
jgi:hypothetical protein